MVKTSKDVKVKEKKVKTKTKAKVKKENYIKSVIKEMKLVKWPTWKEVIKSTISTLVLIIIIVVFFLLLNLLLSVVKGWFA